MKRHTKLNSEQQQEQISEHKLEQQHGYEFETAEKLLSFDASHAKVPSGIAERLKKSSGGIPPPSRSWWQRFFKR
jgi:hypothetical protein